QLSHPLWEIAARHREQAFQEVLVTLAEHQNEWRYLHIPRSRRRPFGRERSGQRGTHEIRSNAPGIGTVCRPIEVDIPTAIDVEPGGERLDAISCRLGDDSVIRRFRKMEPRGPRRATPGSAWPPGRL